MYRPYQEKESPRPADSRGHHWPQFRLVFDTRDQFSLICEEPGQTVLSGFPFTSTKQSCQIAVQDC